ncbi:MAG: aminoacetone oxidase family FAD-binding enzyme [Clostridia bacterium]|nr:aminoacetone oxidase family FAD-binding enzyme [Clostridia bacterium]
MGNYSIVIIGGGFSGLIAAEILSEKYGAKVAVIERNDRVGKKILSTGNGRGNFTNEVLSEKNYHSLMGANTSYAIEKFGNKSIKDYFASLGVLSSSEEDKVYPSSFQASSLLDALRSKLAYNGGKEITGEKCLEVSLHDGKFFIKTSSGEYSADKVVLSCGGKSGKQFGTDGTAYSLAAPFGHKVTKLYPSLVQIKTSTDSIKGLKGIKQVARLKAYEGDKLLSESVGDILFTDYGVSGNAAFYLSSYITNKPNSRLIAEFLPEKTEKEIEDFLVEKSRLGFVKAEDALLGVVNKQLGRAIMKKIGANAFDEKTAKKAAKEIKNFELKVLGTLGFDYSQVTRGGIEFNGVNERTFESKYVKGLYIIGEMLDVDGDCGGYNLQWAYSSARCAAEDLL